MAAVSVFSSLKASAASAKAQAGQQQGGQPSGFFSFLDQVSSGFDYLITHPLGALVNGVSAFAGLVTFNGRATRAALDRMMGWVQSNPIAALQGWTRRQIAAVMQQVVRLQDFMIKYVRITAHALESEFRAGLRSETKYRKLNDAAIRRYSHELVISLHQQIEREAVSGYRQGFNDRLSEITKVADFIASHNSLVSRLVRDLIAGTLDLASVNDPLARLALGFVMRHIIDRLGIDRIAGAWTADLLGPLLGQPRPRGLTDVIADMSARLGAVEQQWSQFYANGGAEVEQAGQEWRNITAPLADAALIAWLGQAAIDPVRWARELSGVLNPALNGIKEAAVTLFREVK